MSIEYAMKNFFGVRLRTETRMLFWAGDTWMVKQTTDSSYRRGKLLLETQSLAEAMGVLMEDAQPVLQQGIHREDG